MMFTSIKVLPSSCEGRVVRVKYEPLRQTTSCWVGRDKQAESKTSVSKGGAQYDPRTRPGWMHSQGAARISRSSTYKCI